ncbi:MAG: Hpt domain-containing protein [Flavobacteriales bacterium]
MATRHIDLSNLERLFKGNRSRVEEWIRLYLTEAPVYFQQMREGLAANNAGDVASAAHDLRPQAHYLGVATMVRMLASIEELASTNGTSACRNEVNALLALGEEVGTELRTVIGPGRKKDQV